MPPRLRSAYMDIKTVLQDNIDQYTDHLDADVAS